MGSRILLKPDEVKDELQITDRQFRRLVQEHKLPVVKVTGKTGEVRVRRADLDAFLEARYVPAERGPLAGQ